MLLTKKIISAGVIYCFSTMSCYANELVISKEQQLMVAGAVKGVGCVKVKSKDSITALTKSMALLKAKSTLLTTKTVSGKEYLRVNQYLSDANTLVTQHFSSGERVVAGKPKQVFYFQEISGGFYCVKI